MSDSNIRLFEEFALPSGSLPSPGNFRELPRRRRPPHDRDNVADGPEEEEDEEPALFVWGKYKRRAEIGVERHFFVSVCNSAQYGQVSFQLENIHTARRYDLVHEVRNGSYKVFYTLATVGLYHVHFRSCNRTVFSSVILGHEARTSATSHTVGSGTAGATTEGTGATTAQSALATPGPSTEPTPASSNQMTSAEMEFRPFGKRKRPGQESQDYERTISMSFTPRTFRGNLENETSLGCNVDERDAFTINCRQNLLEPTPPPWMEHSLLPLTEGSTVDAGQWEEASENDELSGGLYALDYPEPAQERVLKWATRRFGVPVTSTAPAGSESERWSKWATIASVDVPPTPPPPKKRKPVLLTRINTNYILPSPLKLRPRRPINYRV